MFAPADEDLETLKSEKPNRSPEMNMKYFALEMRAHLVEKTWVKLHRDLSLGDGFKELYTGHDWMDEFDEETGWPPIDE